jgi:hypothetical protein
MGGMVSRTVYENKNPGDPTIPATRYTLEHGDGRWKTVSPYGKKFTAKGRHIFVVLDGSLFISRRTIPPGMRRAIGHHDLAQGGPVEFAGEVKFGGRSNQRGIVFYWNDLTGHYHDDRFPMNPEIVPQLPQKLFQPYKGGSG